MTELRHLLAVCRLRRAQLARAEALAAEIARTAAELRADVLAADADLHRAAQALAETGEAPAHAS